MIGLGLPAQVSVFTPAQRVAEVQSFESVVLLNIQSDRSSIDLPEELEDFELFNLNTSALNTLTQQRSQAISLSIPRAHGTLEVNLVAVDPFAAGFMVTEMPSGIQHKMTQEEIGMHYRGVVEGEEGSIAAFSIYEDEISGMIAIPGIDGNLVVGKLANNSEHILYTDKDIRSAQDFVCATDDNDAVPHDEIQTSQRATERCPEIFFDISKEIYDGKGGVSGATNYITAIFNQVAVLYNNDNMNIVLAGVNVWSSDEPFSDLNSYGSYRNSNGFNGDLAEYVNYSFGGGIAWLNALCGGSPYSVSGVTSSYSNVPTYSWSVEVMAHELGHNLGSPHTHACAWNGNNTAIDGCGANAGYSEGCSGSNPSGGGTIMSYCHLTSVGINFALGFGSQPTARISGFIDNSSCVSNCGPAPTCDDGIQNGQETGVDCGGTECPACPFLCDYNTATLTLSLDQYPQETTWSILDDSGASVASGGPYDGLANSTLPVNICLENGCYDFVINDSYGDGICCGYGNGSYSLADESGAVLVSGGSFGSSETKAFCINSTPPVDCDISDTAPADLTKSFDPVNGTEDRLQVKFYKESPEVKYSSADSAACDILFWKKRTLDPQTGQVFGNPIQNPDSILLAQVQKTNNNPLFKWPVKYRADGANNTKRVDPNYRYEWKVRCYCDKGNGAVSPWSQTKTFNTPNFDTVTGINGGGNSAPSASATKSVTGQFSAELFPNPANGELNIRYKTNKGVTSTVQVMDMFGKVIDVQEIAGSGAMMNLNMDVSDLSIGNYIISIVNDGQLTTQRFSITR